MKTNIIYRVALSQTRRFLTLLFVLSMCLQGNGQKVITGTAISQSKCFHSKKIGVFGNVVSIEQDQNGLWDSYHDNIYHIGKFVPEATNMVSFTVKGNTVSLYPQYLYLDSEYGECYLRKCNQDGTVIYNFEYPIEGTIDDNGIITLTDTWCIAYNSYNPNGVTTKAKIIGGNTIIRPANAKMEVSYYSTSEKETYDVYIDQSSDFETIDVYNFDDFGQTVKINVNSDNTITIMPTQLVYDSDETKEAWSDGSPLYDLYAVTTANWGIINPFSQSIIGTITSKDVYFPNWVLMDRNYVYSPYHVYNYAKIYLTGKETFGIPETLRLGVYPESLIYKADGGQQNVTISSNGLWSANCSEAWIHCSPSKGSGESSIVTVYTDANTSMNARQGTITITAETSNKASITRTITIAQKGVQKQEIEIGGVGYDLDVSTMSATVLEIEPEKINDNGVIEIPETITVPSNSARATRAVDTNMLFTVKAIGDSILAKMAANKKQINSVSFPSTIEKVSQKAFDKARAKALIWNSNTKMPETAFKNLSDSLKNMLIYVNHDSIAPQHFANIIIMEKNTDSLLIAQLHLYEASEFYCPKEFQADSVSFTHKFTMKTAIAKKDSTSRGQGWETMVLPFDVEKISYKKNDNEYNLLPFDTYQVNHNDNDRPFWLYEWDEEAKAFKSAKTMEANKPYLISMPNNNEYAQDYNIEGEVTFSAKHALIKDTSVEELYLFVQTEKSFCASYSYLDNDTMQDYILYCLNSENDVFGHNEYDYSSFMSSEPNPGSMFIATSKIQRDAYPFEGFIVLPKSLGATSRDFLEIEFSSIDEKPAQSIKEVLSKSTGTKSSNGIYNLAGQRLVQDGSQVQHDLPAGVYIVNGKKMVMKQR